MNKKYKVAKGASRCNDLIFVRSAKNINVASNCGCSDLGFRIVRNKPTKLINRFVAILHEE